MLSHLLSGSQRKLIAFAFDKTLKSVAFNQVRRREQPGRGRAAGSFSAESDVGVAARRAGGALARALVTDWSAAAPATMTDTCADAGATTSSK